jgi:hypothetical protein
MNTKLTVSEAEEAVGQMEKEGYVKVKVVSCPWFDKSKKRN